MENKSSNSSESLWRGKLSAAQRTDLRAQPELAIEARLTEAIANIPDAAVPSNFTARVMAAIDLEETAAARSRGWHWSWRSLLPRLAVATAVLIFAGVSIQRYEAGSHRAALVKSVVQVAAAQPVPSLEALNNFEAIQRMSQRADDQLLALMQ